MTICNPLAPSGSLPVTNTVARTWIDGNRIGLLHGRHIAEYPRLRRIRDVDQSACRLDAVSVT